MSTVVERDHARFLGSLAESVPTVFLVARWFHARGHIVTVPPLSQAPTRDEWRKHSDSGDLYVRRPHEPEWRRIEVKQLGYQFTGRADWPFGDRYIVTSKGAFDRATDRGSPRPYAYIHVSQDQRHAGIVMVSDYPLWTVANRRDGRLEQKIERPQYFCPIERVRFIALEI
jgi:hypothetical protein